MRGNAAVVGADVMLAMDTATAVEGSSGRTKALVCERVEAADVPSRWAGTWMMVPNV
jgi:hypothetical protein